jgi:hypothetical protein
VALKPEPGQPTRWKIYKIAAKQTWVGTRGDLDLVVFCIAEPEDAEAFGERFDGER